jgi:hypothetical protein
VGRGLYDRPEDSRPRTLFIDGGQLAETAPSWLTECAEPTLSI